MLYSVSIPNDFRQFFHLLSQKTTLQYGIADDILRISKISFFKFICCFLLNWEKQIYGCSVFRIFKVGEKLKSLHSSLFFSCIKSLLVKLKSFTRQVQISE